MNNKVREIFEKFVYPSFDSTAHGLRRKQNGEYVSDILEDHWNTFQEGWEYAIAYVNETDNPQYSNNVINYITWTKDE